MLCSGGPMKDWTARTSWMKNKYFKNRSKDYLQRGVLRKILKAIFYPTRRISSTALSNCILVGGAESSL